MALPTEHYREVKSLYHTAKMAAYLVELNIPPPPPGKKEKWATLLKEAKEAGTIPAFPPMWEWVMGEGLLDPDTVREHLHAKEETKKLRVALRNNYLAYVREAQYTWIENSPRYIDWLSSQPKDLVPYTKKTKKAHLHGLWREWGYTLDTIVVQTYKRWVAYKLKPYKAPPTTLETYDFNPYTRNE
jgi:hypothetical protein